MSFLAIAEACICVNFIWLTFVFCIIADLDRQHLPTCLGWQSDKEARDTLRDFYELIAYSLQLGDLFQVHGDSGRVPSGTVTSSTSASAAAAANHGSGGGSGANGHGRSNGATSAHPPSHPHAPHSHDLPSLTHRGTVPTHAHAHAHAHTGSSTSASSSGSTGTGPFSAPGAPSVLHVDTANPSYVFRGLVCYYGQHYVSIFQSREVGRYEYLLFDDHNIKTIGDWEAVKQKCVMSCYQPVLLLYELES